MRKLIFDETERVVAFMKEQLQRNPAWHDDVQAIGVEDETGQLIAGVCYENFTLCDVNIHIASRPGIKNWVTREGMVRVYQYPFILCKLRRITALLEASNHAARRMNTHMGFVVEGIKRNAYPNGDMLIMGMLKEDCRFIKGLEK